MRRTYILSLALVLALMAAPGTARGDADREAQRLLTTGISHYANGEFHKAIALLKQAADKALKPALLARVHAYLGVNYFVTNQRDKARDAFTRALEHDPGIKLEVKEVGASILRLFEATRKGYQGSLRVEVARPNTLVRVDGQKVGKAPWQGKLAIGHHRLSLSTEDGKWHCEQQVVVRINVVARATCKLRQYAGKLSLAVTPAGAEVLLTRGRSLGKAPLRALPMPVGEHRLRVRLAGHDERLLTVTVNKGKTTKARIKLVPLSSKPAARRKLKTLLAYTFLGTGAALLTGAAVMYGIGASEGSDAYDEYRASTASSQYEAGRQSIESAREKLVVGHVLAGVGLAAVGLSVYQFVTRPRVEAAPAPRSALSITPAAGGALMTLGGSF